MRIDQFPPGSHPSSAVPAHQPDDVYETKASEVKELALQIHGPEARGALVTLARGYELLAESMRSWRRRLS